MKHLYLILLLLTTTLCWGQQAPESAEIPGFNMYPNPVVDGKLHVRTTDKRPKKILIFDVLGTQVMETTILGEELNLSHLKSGIYVIRVVVMDKIATRKLIIK